VNDFGVASGVVARVLRAELGEGNSGWILEGVKHVAGSLGRESATCDGVTTLTGVPEKLRGTGVPGLQLMPAAGKGKAVETLAWRSIAGLCGRLRHCAHAISITSTNMTNSTDRAIKRMNCSLDMSPGDASSSLFAMF